MNIGSICACARQTACACVTPGVRMDLRPVVSFLRRLCTDMLSLVEGTATVPLESFGSGLELAYRELVAYEILAGNSITQEQSEAIDYVRAAMRVVRRVSESIHYGGLVGSLGTGVGRPRLAVTREQLESLIEANFTAPQIAHMLGVSISTVRRRMDMYNMSIRATYATLSNEELDQVVREVTCQFPACGSKQMAGHLLSRGFRVQQNRGSAPSGPSRGCNATVDSDATATLQCTSTPLRLPHRWQPQVNQVCLGSGNEESLPDTRLKTFLNILLITCTCVVIVTC